MSKSVTDFQWITSILSNVENPGRYIGNEPNSIVKEQSKVKISFALVFPEVYEIGMSHHGLRILYHILNSYEDVQAERVFAPWVDFGNFIKLKNIPLFSLETKKPLKEFDLVGFSLQSELNYTNIPYILELAQIPRFFFQRESSPFILAGGGTTANPEPISKFFDFLVIGDGEDVIKEIIELFRIMPPKFHKRHDLLKELSLIEGVYVPSIHKRKDAIKIKRRWVSKLDKKTQPNFPIIPIVSVVQERINLEIMRGCTRGCRFCQAGFWYRPTREMNPSDLLSILKDSLQNTGMKEVGLLSLSTADYSQIDYLTEKISERFKKDFVSISLPSLRIDTFSVNLAKKVGEVRKSGFTFAPEAGSERLRQVINKNITQEEILQTVKIVYENGWDLVKLYFMIGLPTETEKDIEELVNLIYEIGKLGKGFKRRKNVKANIGIFVPKPFTPFQWDKFENLKIIEERLSYIKDKLKYPWINLKWHNLKMALIEAVLSRGDSKLCNLINHVYNLGCKFDNWDDLFKFEVWEKGFSDLSINYHDYLKERDLDEIFPWDFIDSGITKDFLIKEREKAFKGEKTLDCKWGRCNFCGIPKEADIVLAEKLEEENSKLFSEEERSKKTFPYFLEYEKIGNSRFLSHFTTIKLITLALFRAGLKLKFTEGFNPSPKIITSPALPLGIMSLSEYIQLELYEPITINLDKINKYLINGLRVKVLKPITNNEIDINKPILTSYHLYSPYNLKFEVDFSKKELSDNVIIDEVVFNNERFFNLHFKVKKDLKEPIFVGIKRILEEGFNFPYNITDFIVIKKYTIYSKIFK